MSRYKVCDECKAHLDAGEICDCKEMLSFSKEETRALPCICPDGSFDQPVLVLHKRHGSLRYLEDFPMTQTYLRANLGTTLQVFDIAFFKRNEDKYKVSTVTVSVPTDKKCTALFCEDWFGTIRFLGMDIPFGERLEPESF